MDKLGGYPHGRRRFFLPDWQERIQSMALVHEIPYRFGAISGFAGQIL